MAAAAQLPESGAAVQLIGISKRYGIAGGIVTALAEVNLEIASGSATAVMGPSGSGKSTLLHVVGAMDLPDAGRVIVAGTDLTGLSRSGQVDYRRTIGFVFQRYHLLAALSALDNVAAPLLPRKSAFDKHDRARELLAAVGLAGREDALPSRLSGGQQQRVAIARALINDPVLLLADEPTGNVDSTTADELIELLLQLREERGMTLLIATHDTRIAERCDRIVHLRDGHVVGDTRSDARPD